MEMTRKNMRRAHGKNEILFIGVIEKARTKDANARTMISFLFNMETERIKFL